MSASYVKHSILPTNTKSSYEEFNTIDFVVSAEGRKIIGNSFRLTGKLNVYSTGTTRVLPADDIRYDGTIGAHGVIQSIQTEILNAGGVVETLTEYPRYVGMVGDATQTENDMINGESVCEMKTPIVAQTTLLSAGERGLGTTPVIQSSSFSIKPMFVLNSVVGVEDAGDTSMSYKKTGNITISFTLARNVAFLYGNDVDANVNYTLEDVKLEFLSVPEDNKANKTMHRVKYHVRNSILSGSANVQVQVPAKVNSVNISFLEQSHQNAFTHNNYRRERLPELTALQYLFNNATNEFIQYEIKDRAEWTRRAIESFKAVKHSKASLKNLNSNHAFLLGLNFQEFIDLSNQTFSVQLTSGATSTDPYTAHLYFHSAVEV